MLNIEFRQLERNVQALFEVYIDRGTLGTLIPFFISASLPIERPKEKGAEHIFMSNPNSGVRPLWDKFGLNQAKLV